MWRVRVLPAVCCGVLLLQLMHFTAGQAESQGGVVGAGDVGSPSNHMKSIRITPFYDHTIDDLDSLLSATQQRLIKEVLVQGAVSWLQQVLKVQPMRRPIKLDRSCSGNYVFVKKDQPYCSGDCLSESMCGPSVIPEDHLNSCKKCDTNGNNCGTSSGSGVGVPDSDLVLYVSAVDEELCSRGYTVYAGHCHQELKFDRPISAFLNFCPRRLSVEPKSADSQLAATIHELIHALAFSEDLYPFFRDADGNPRSRRTDDGRPARNYRGDYLIDQNILRTVYRSPWTTYESNDIMHLTYMIVTPTVLREVRSHFDCPSLLGAELENQGGRGVARVHWEKRLFGEEMMTAVLPHKPVVSRITLALLEDSGWYLPDYSYAGRLEWGRGKGCAFVNDSCGGWINYAKERSLEVYPFCSEWQWRQEKDSCIDGRTRVGSCSLKEYEYPLPLEYSYFPRKRGGVELINDFCPIFYAKDYSSTGRIGRDCQNTRHTPSFNFAYESYGRNSRCFDQAERWVSKKDGTVFEEFSPFGASCHRFECTASKLYIIVGINKLKCSRKGQRKRVAIDDYGFTFEGVLKCPSYEEVCADYDCLRMCSGHGKCLEGECRCSPGYFGEDCSRSYSELITPCQPYGEYRCQSGGTCSNSTCHCLPGFTGPFCENPIVPDPCELDPCGGNGRCTRTDMGATAVCHCYQGYSGLRCQNVVDYCLDAGRPCVHGSCRNDTAGICECDPEFTGLQCETFVSCTATTCSNGGTCSAPTMDTFTCLCAEGFEGDRCEVEFTDPCEFSPCLNGGSCQRKSNTEFDCDCSVGFRGQTCEIKIDYCDSSPCQNGGTCSSGVGTFQCACPLGYKGKRCQRWVGCRASTCQNEGVCKEEGVQVVVCQCLNGFTGAVCEESA